MIVKSNFLHPDAKNLTVNKENKLEPRARSDRLKGILFASLNRPGLKGDYFDCLNWAKWDRLKGRLF